VYTLEKTISLLESRENPSLTGNTTVLMKDRVLMKRHLKYGMLQYFCECVCVCVLIICRFPILFLNYTVQNFGVSNFLKLFFI